MTRQSVAGIRSNSLEEESSSQQVVDLCSAHIRILIIDDDAAIRVALQGILEDEGYEVEAGGSGADALQLLQTNSYDIMLCDVFMPGINGLDLLQKIVESWPDMPVILVTGNGSVELARSALHRGASDFITKPCAPGELPIIVERNLTRQALERKRVLRHRLELNLSNESILDAMLSALDTRDTETEGHSERVTAYTMHIADRMGLPDEEMYHIERGALLHDIGKIGIPDRILLKPGPLTAEEWLEMRKHPEIGYRMCSRIDMLKIASQIVLSHHERWDGTGYPAQLHGEEIPLGARIFAVADTMDAMTSDRPYRAAQTYSAVCEEMARHSGKQFDPEIVKIFLSIPEINWTYIRSRSF